MSIKSNHVAAIASVITGAAAFIAGITQALPVSWQSFALAGAGVLGVTATGLKFLDGSQKWDVLTAVQAATPVIKQVEAAVAPVPAPPVLSGPPLAQADPVLHIEAQPPSVPPIAAPPVA